MPKKNKSIPKTHNNFFPTKKKPKNKRKKTRKELKQKAVNYKGGGCEICGYNSCLAALTFHHRNPEEKDFGISELINCISWKKLKQELDRCHLLCLNHHVEVHQGIIDGYIDAEYN